MFYNSLKIILRNLLGNKLYSCINIFGLAVGLASVVLLGLYVRYELGYDHQFAAADRLYRITRDIYPPDNSRDIHMASAPIPLAALLEQDFPEIEETARMRPVRVLLSRDDAAYYEDGARYVDPAFFSLFDFEWLQGDARHAFDEPDSIVLTRSKAARYFGSEDPLGQTVLLENQRPLKVTGVIADLPRNTHLTGDAFITLESFLRILPAAVKDGWGANMMHTYVRLAPGASIEALEQKLPDFTDRYIGPDAHEWSAFTPMKVTDIHLHSTLDYELQPPGSFTTVLTLITVAVGILLIACFNFMNLATARSMLRSKEVGVRKTIGSLRGQLVRLFLLESIGMTLLATLLALVLVELVLPAFVGFTGKQIAFDPLNDQALQVLLVALVFVVGLIAGSYPAFYLSAFKPVQVLRGGAVSAVGGVLLRNLLVIMQFAISITLVVVTAVVFLQLRYARDYDPGFNREQVVVLKATASRGLTDRWETLKERLLANPDILSVTASDNTPGVVNINGLGLTLEGSTESHNMPPVLVDYNFFETYDVEVLAGRLFSPEFPADQVTMPGEANTRGTGNIILNAAGAREFGLSPEAATGRSVDTGNGISGRIVGVVADSNFESVRSSIKPLAFLLVPSGFLNPDTPVFVSASVRISGRNINESLAWIDSTWAEVIPDFPISRSFLSDNFEALYQDDARLGQMFSTFAALAIIIACLGLYGLATFNTQRRLKEIGIRKVLGGSIWNIVLLLTNDFSKLVLISNLIAWPLAYVAMQRWLENFAYRIDLTPLVFIGSGLIALCIAWVTVGSTAAKAASQKPVLALRYE